VASRFVNKAESIEDALKLKTIGLQRLEDFRGVRRELEEQQARQAAKTDELKWVFRSLDGVLSAWLVLFSLRLSDEEGRYLGLTKSDARRRKKTQRSTHSRLLLTKKVPMLLPSLARQKTTKTKKACSALVCNA
jgi:hypothetical protein